jgi:hypothetical protein
MSDKVMSPRKLLASLVTNRKMSLLIHAMYQRIGVITFYGSGASRHSSDFNLIRLIRGVWTACSTSSSPGYPPRSRAPMEDPDGSRA